MGFKQIIRRFLSGLYPSGASRLSLAFQVFSAMALCFPYQASANLVLDPNVTASCNYNDNPSGISGIFCTNTFSVDFGDVNVGETKTIFWNIDLGTLQLGEDINAVSAFLIEALPSYMPVNGSGGIGNLASSPTYPFVFNSDKSLYGGASYGFSAQKPNLNPLVIGYPNYIPLLAIDFTPTDGGIALDSFFYIDIVSSFPGRTITNPEWQAIDPLYFVKFWNTFLDGWCALDVFGFYEGLCTDPDRYAQEFIGCDDPLVPGGPISYFDTWAGFCRDAGIDETIPDPTQNRLHVEVALYGNGVFPVEPPTGAPLPGVVPLMLAGLGALALAGWRRKRTAAA